MSMATPRAIICAMRLDRCAVTENAVNVAIESLNMSDEEGTAVDTPEMIFCQITLKS